MDMANVPDVPRGDVGLLGGPLPVSAVPSSGSPGEFS
jgi:hypothetical protein